MQCKPRFACSCSRPPILSANVAFCFAIQSATAVLVFIRPSPVCFSPDAAAFRVARGVYRSSYPTKKTLPFLKQIGVRSIVYLCLEEYTESAKKFLEENDIQLFPHGTPGRHPAAAAAAAAPDLSSSFAGNKEPFDRVDEAAIYSALQVRRALITRRCVFSNDILSRFDILFDYLCTCNGAPADHPRCQQPPCRHPLQQGAAARMSRQMRAWLMKRRANIAPAAS